MFKLTSACVHCTFVYFSGGYYELREGLLRVWSVKEEVLEVLPRVDEIGRYAVFLILIGTLLELEDHFDRVRASALILLL